MSEQTIYTLENVRNLSTGDTPLLQIMEKAHEVYGDVRAGKTPTGRNISVQFPVEYEDENTFFPVTKVVSVAIPVAGLVFGDLSENRVRHANADLAQSVREALDLPTPVIVETDEDDSDDSDS